MSNQNAKNETVTVGEELFMEELGQIQGGQIPPLKVPTLPLTMGIYQVEYGNNPPVFPDPEPKPKPLTTSLLENIVAPVRF